MTTTQAQTDEMRSLVLDCCNDEGQEQWAREASAGALRSWIARNYDGGLRGWEADGCSPPARNLQSPEYQKAVRAYWASLDERN